MVGAVHANQPPLFCAVGTGGVSTGCSEYFSTRAEASSTLSDRKLAAMTAANAGYPRTWTGALVVPAYVGNYTTIRWSRVAQWVNGAYTNAETESGDIFQICPLVNGVRATPGNVEATACPGSPTCLAGEITSYNITAGWNRGLGGNASYPDRMPDGSVPANGYIGTPPLTMCIRGCIQTQVSGGPDNSWLSKVAVNGMYRISDDWKYMKTATECTVTSSESARLDSTALPPACDGSAGLINGKAVCVPTSAGQTNLLQGDKAASTVKEGNPVSGSSGGLSNIPATGTGTNAGGPLTSTTNQPLAMPGGGPGASGPGATTSTGTTTATTPSTSTTTFETCGIPGQPACKIDETGTPGTATMAIDTVAIEAAQAARRGTITGKSDKSFLDGFSSFFVTPPMATCVPITMPISSVGVQIPPIDPCETVGGIRAFMAWLWAVGGLFLCVGFVREAI